MSEKTSKYAVNQRVLVKKCPTIAPGLVSSEFSSEIFETLIL